MDPDFKDIDPGGMGDYTGGYNGGNWIKLRVKRGLFLTLTIPTTHRSLGGLFL